MRFVACIGVCHIGRAWSGFAAWNAWFNALLLQRVPEPLSIVTPVGKHPPRLGQIIEQGRCAGVIADLAGGDEEAQRAAVGIRDGVKLGVHTTFGPSDQAPEIPFFTPRLEAVR